MPELQPHWSELFARLGQMVTGCAAAGGGLWALLTYTRMSKRQSAEWIQGIFEKFQLGAEFEATKILLDFQYREVVEPMLAAMLATGSDALKEDEWLVSHRFDRLLNFLEHIRYLVKTGHVREDDCRAYFGYWLTLLKDGHRGALRRYLVKFDYEQLAAWSGASRGEYLLVYGTLLASGTDSTDVPHLGKWAEPVGPMRDIPGTLYDLLEYPAYVPDAPDAGQSSTYPGPGQARPTPNGVVKAQLYQILKPQILQELDQYEDYDRLALRRSLYRRTTIRIPEQVGGGTGAQPDQAMIDPWIYVYNRPLAGAPAIERGSWLEHRKERAPRFKFRRIFVDDAAWDQVVALHDAAAAGTARLSRNFKELSRRADYYVIVAEIDAHPPAGHGSSVVGFSITYVADDSSFALLQYIAVREEFRSRGIGHALFRNSVSSAGTRTPLLLEVPAAHGDAASGARDSARRFFFALGCLAVRGLDYILPLSDGATAGPMELFVDGLAEGRVPRAAMVEWLTGLYVRVYGLQADDPRLRKMIEPLGKSLPLGRVLSPAA